MKKRWVQATSREGQIRVLPITSRGSWTVKVAFTLRFNGTVQVRAGWQLVPEFHVSQHESSKEVLQLLADFLGCGYVKPNHRRNPKDVTWVYVVRSRADLMAKVIPFFREFQLRTAKRRDFELFAEIVVGMCEGEHKTRGGLIRLLSLAFEMNKSGRYRRESLDKILKDLEPSETVRQTPCQKAKIQSDLHGDVQRWVERPARLA